MKKKTIAFVGNLLIFISAVSALVLAVMLKPTSITVLVIFGGWVLLPYLLFASFVKIGTMTFQENVQIVLICCLCSLGGIYIMVDAMFIHSDPQGGFVVIFTPLLQLVAFAILFFAAFAYTKFFAISNKP